MLACIFGIRSMAFPLGINWIDQKEYEVHFGEQECLNLLDDARKSLDELNKLIQKGLLMRILLNHRRRIANFAYTGLDAKATGEKTRY